MCNTFGTLPQQKNRILGGKEYWQLCLKTGVRKVISKRRSSLVWEGTEGPFRENISTKVNKTIKSKKKTTELLKEYIKPTSTKRPYHYESCQLQFIGRGHQSYQNQGSMPRHGQRKLYSRGGRCKLESQPPILLNLSDYQKIHSPVKTFFKEIWETFPLGGRLKNDYKRFSNPKHSQGLFYRLHGDSLQTKNTNEGNIKLSSWRTYMTAGERNAGER